MTMMNNQPNLTVSSIPAGERYRILSLDGGGIRGLLTARILQRIDQACPGFIDRANLVAGTSSGSMITAGIARGLPFDQIIDIFRKQGPVIFKRSFVRATLGLMGLISAKYGTENRRKTLQDALGDAKLGDLAKRILISSFQLDSENEVSPSDIVPRTWKTKFFHNFPGKDSDEDQRLVDVVLRSSAAPTFFPIFQGFIDGGVVANNPSMCAVAQALHPDGANRDIEDVVLFSVGAGFIPHVMRSLFGDFGFLRWGIRLYELISDGQVGLPDYQCNQILFDRYYRINPMYPIPVAIDDPSGIDELLAMAESVDLKPVIAWINTQWM